MKLGNPEISLAVSDIKASLAFYEALGFKRVEGAEAEKWVVVAQSDLRIGLYQGHVDANSLTFFGGDIEAIAVKLHEAGFELKQSPETEEDGSSGAKAVDPDGNLIYFNT
ncbi:VOC family protein [Prosthecobacter sp.]|jgi:catechol 2,3-dioxygenase-like lactoylglutathione lyase family enzyme|uniref:VOC family protein n=1 Tax=Prosthecobacter sp. TaxID=1965333 RepID=UPI0037CA64E0